MNKPQPKIISDPNVHHGKPVIAGPRVPMDIVVGSIAGGMSWHEVQDEYRISEDDIRAALRYAAKD